MRAYTVHAPPGEDHAPERFAFVKEGISWPALFFPVLWILWHRLWLTLVGAIIAVLVLLWVERLAGDDAAAILALLGALLFALEANNIRRLSLESRGWRELGASMGGSLEDAEFRFFENWNRAPAGRGAPAREEAVGAAPYAPPARHNDPDGAIFGLFPEPER